MRNVILVRTAPDDPPGSMSAYARLVEQAVTSVSDFDVRIIHFFDPCGGGSMRRHHLWRLRHARSVFSENSADIYHLLDGSMAGFLPSRVREKTIVTVHDLIPLLQLKGRLSGSPGWFARLLIHRMVNVLKQVAGLAAVSEHTAVDLQEFTSRSDIAVIHNPVRELPAPDNHLNVPERFLFHIGNNAAYKNRTGVLDVFNRLQDIPDLHLIMAGPEPLPELRRKADTLKRVQFVVNPSDFELSLFYKKATAFLFPSLYEGFGMPVLEAMSSGCPVVCSDAASLPEVTGDAALIAQSGDIEALARHCRRILNDASFRDELIQRGRQRTEHFTMQRLSAELKEWYKSTL